MGMGIPILHGVEGESAGIVEREGAGICFEPDNADALISSLMTLKRDAALYDKIRKRGPVAAENYNRRNLAMEMLGLIEKVAAKRR